MASEVESKNFLSQTLLANYEHLLNSAKQWWDFCEPIFASCYAFDWFEEMAATDLRGALKKLQEQLLLSENVALCEKVKLQDAEKGNYSMDRKIAVDILISLILNDKNVVEDFVRVFEGAETEPGDSSAINVIPYMLDCLDHQAVMLQTNVMLNKATEFELESTTLTDLANAAFRRGRNADGELLTKCSVRLDMLSGKQLFHEVSVEEEVRPAPKVPKPTTVRAGARDKLIAALTMHHKYADGGCLNLEPIGNNELARLVGVAKRTASAFFNKEFQGHSKYIAVCGDSGLLVTALKMLNSEFAPHLLYGNKPPEKWGNHDEADDE